MNEWIFKFLYVDWFGARRVSCRLCEFLEYQVATFLPFVLMEVLYHE